MKVVVVLVLLLCFVTYTGAAEVAPIPKQIQQPKMLIKTASKIRPISEIKKIKFRYQPVLVQSTGTDLSDTLSNSDTSIGDDTAYKTGSGVILRPALLKDPVTRSELSISNIRLTSDMVTKLQNKDPDLDVGMGIGGDAHQLFNGAFYSIPQGMHTYVLTCRLSLKSTDIYNSSRDNEILSNRLVFFVGNQRFGRDKQSVNSETNEISVIFTFKPIDASPNFSQFYFFAQLEPNDSPYSFGSWIQLWYVQLVQLN